MSDTENGLTSETSAEDDAIAAMGDAYVQEFYAAYVECALWSESAGITVDDDGTVTEAPDDDTSFQSHNFDASDLTDDAARETYNDCVAFIAGNVADLQEVAALPEQSGRESYSAGELAGHDFWLTRNGHGAGFWDRGYGAVGRRLSDACDPFGETHLYVVMGDDSDIVNARVGIE